MNIKNRKIKRKQYKIINFKNKIFQKTIFIKINNLHNYNKTINKIINNQLIVMRNI